MLASITWQSSKTHSNADFRMFVAGMDSRDPLIGAFKEHIENEGFPDAAAWGQLRIALGRTGADQATMVGARMAWKAFRNYDG